jgi:hypothetical protein
MIKEGTLWGSADSKVFRVLHTVEIEGKTWVHYREDFGLKVPADECKKFSCYEESFLARFRQLPE